jgi:hypothetical protein
LELGIGRVGGERANAEVQLGQDARTNSMSVSTLQFDMTFYKTVKLKPFDNTVTNATTLPTRFIRRPSHVPTLASEVLDHATTTNAAMEHSR